MTHVLHDWFGWPDGSVLTNLVAWLIGLLMGLGVPVWRIFRKLDVIHQHAAAAHEHAKNTHAHVVANVPVKRARPKP